LAKNLDAFLLSKQKGSRIVQDVLKVEVNPVVERESVIVVPEKDNPKNRLKKEINDILEESDISHIKETLDKLKKSKNEKRKVYNHIAEDNYASHVKKEKYIESVSPIMQSRKITPSFVNFDKNKNSKEKG